MKVKLKNKSAKKVVSEKDVIKALPDFVNTFGTNFSSCISCSQELPSNLPSNFDSALSKKVLKEICIKSIVPYEVNVDSSQLDESFPFCQECTATVSKLTDLYRQLQTIQEEFNEIRCQVVKWAIKAFVQIRQGKKEVEGKVFEYWTTVAGHGYPIELVRIDEDEDENDYEAMDLDSEEIIVEPEDEGVDVTRVKIERDSMPWEDNTPLDDFTSLPDFPFHLLRPEDEIKSESESGEDNDIVVTQPSVDSADTIEIIIPDIDNVINQEQHQDGTDEDQIAPKIKSIRGARSQAKVKKPVKKTSKTSGITEDKIGVQTRRQSSRRQVVTPIQLKLRKKNKNEKTKGCASTTPKSNTKKKSVTKKAIKKEMLAIPAVNEFFAISGLESSLKSEKPETVSEHQKKLRNRKKKRDSNNILAILDEGLQLGNISETEESQTNKSEKKSGLRKRKKMEEIEKSQDTLNEEGTTVTVKTDKIKRRRKGTTVKTDKIKRRRKGTTVKTDKIKRRRERTPKVDPETGKRKKRINRPAQCSVCGKLICSTYNLKLHMRTHSGEKPFKCTHCDMSFYKPPNLQTHMLKHTNAKPHTCELCGAKFSYRQVLKSHKASQHNIFDTEVLSECEFCLKKYVTQGELNKHIRRIHVDIEGKAQFRNIACSFCNVTFGSVEYLKEHQKSEKHVQAVNLAEEAIKCEIKRPHYDIKSGEAFEVTCGECGMKFASTRILTMHERKVHRKRDYVCETCGKEFMQKNNLNKHMIIHMANKPYVCADCGDQFNTQVSLTVHQTKHTGEGIFNCEHCGAGFNRIRKYRKHLCDAHADIHLLEKPAVCLGCYKNFGSDAELEDHMKLHSDSKCEHCGKIFDCKFSLSKHLQTHDALRPYKCMECDKTFVDETKLKEHIGRHRGQRPYPCTECDSAFLGEKWLLNHMVKAHSNSQNSDRRNAPEQSDSNSAMNSRTEPSSSECSQNINQQQINDTQTNDSEQLQPLLPSHPPPLFTIPGFAEFVL